jgi:uncharacterized protein YdbL (DUF1318 family)
MMKRMIYLCAAIAFMLGCARLSVQGSKEPIKLDISMRLDIYQHVEKDITAIEDIVSGSEDKNQVIQKQSFLGFLVGRAYAEDGLSPEVEQAALRRKARIQELYDFEIKGLIGENKSGFLEARGNSQATGAAGQLIAAENSDRMIIYKALAAKNNISLEEVEQLYAKRLQNDAPPGTPIEALNSATGAGEWNIKP